MGFIIINRIMPLLFLDQNKDSYRYGHSQYTTCALYGFKYKPFIAGV